jgi:imidazolonepropionase-like amidohydrolase
VRVIEGKGLRVYPGMIDSATELGLAEVPSVRETVDTGELGEFMPQLRAVSAVNPASERFPVVKVNGITAVMTFPAPASSDRRTAERQYVAGQAALINTDGWTWEEMALRPAAALQLFFPAWRAGRGGGEPGPPATPPAGSPAAQAQGQSQGKRAYDEEIAKVERFFESARHYMKVKSANAPGFERDLKYEAMIPVLEGKVPVAVYASRPAGIRDAIKFAEKQNIKIVIMQPRDIKSVAADLKARNIPVVLGRVMALPDEEDDPYDSSYRLPAEAYKAGVKFALGSFNNEFTRNLPYQAAMAVAFGLPYEEALKAITINAAEIWGVGAETGSVDTGKRADLIVTNGDPLEIRTSLKRVFIKGMEVELTSRQIKLYEKYANRP